MKKTIKNKLGEAHINTAIIIIIAVVIGGLLLGGLYLVFAGDNGVMAQADNKIYDMFNTGNVRTLKFEQNQLLYSYDEKTWYECNIAGMDETGSVKRYVTLTPNDETTVHLVCVHNTTNDVVYCSMDGVEWVPVKTSSSGITLSVSSTGRTAYIYYGNGMSYASVDGVDWVMTSTKNY